MGKRIEERVTLHILTANNPCSIIDPKAKPGDRMRFEGDVVFVDEDSGRVTVQVLERVTVEASTVELVRTFQRPRGTEPLRQKPTQHKRSSTRRAYALN